MINISKCESFTIDITINLSIESWYHNYIRIGDMYTKHTDTILLFVFVVVCGGDDDFIFSFFLTYRDMRKVMVL